MDVCGSNVSLFVIIISPFSPVFDEMPIKGLRYLSQSTDSLNRTNQVTESMESLTDEGQYTSSQPEGMSSKFLTKSAKKLSKTFLI